MTLEDEITRADQRTADFEARFKAGTHRPMDHFSFVCHQTQHPTLLACPAADDPFVYVITSLEAPSE